MPHLPVKVLLVDDDEDDFIITRDLFAECDHGPFALEWLATYAAAWEAIQLARHDVYLVDYRLGEQHGLDLLREAVAWGCQAPIIILTGQGDHAVDVEAMKAGAADFLVKGQLTPALLERTIRYALERAHSIEALRHSEERYRILYESNPQPMWVYDRESLAILTVNDAAIHHYGYSREEFLGMTIKDLHLPEQLPALLEDVRTRSGGCHKASVWKQRKKNGALAEVEITPHDLVLDDHLATLVLAKDVTEHLNLEAQLRQSQKMDSIGQLAAGVAHDFNNILSVIQGHACLLLAARDLASDTADSLAQIRLAAERAANLTRQLLTFSRRQHMQRKVLNLNEVIHNVAKMLERLLEEHIALELRLAPQLPFINADSGMIEQILVNLSVNSRDAMPHGGLLTLSTRATRIDTDDARNNPESSPGHYVLLTVADTGSGMDAKVLARIFEPFFTTKGVGKGTGLGLATVYGIVKQHQGWLEVNSKVGHGTTFKVFLPACPLPSRTSDEERDPVSPRGGTERVLVVEDEPPVLMLVEHILQTHGYRVLTAASGVEALELWQKETDPIQLLLTDMVMPNGVSGWELGTRLQAAHPDLKVIYTSGYSIDLVGREVELREGYNFLQKPYPPRKLVQTVRDRLDSRPD